MEQIPLLKTRQSSTESHYNPFINIPCEPLVVIQGTWQLWHWTDFRGIQPLVEKDFSRTWVGYYTKKFLMGKIQYFSKQVKMQPRRCALVQVTVPCSTRSSSNFVITRGILFSIAVRNSQWVYQDSVKYHSVVSSLQSSHLIAEYTHKNLSSSGWWITAALLRWRDFRIQAPERKEDK